MVQRPFVIIKEIKTTGLERAVISTISCPNTTIIGHRIKTFLSMYCGVNGADSFTWCSLALRARDRQRHKLRILKFFVYRMIVIMIIFFHVWCKISVHPKPVHFTTHNDLVFSNDWDIIFRLTCNIAGIAAITDVEVNCHTPLLNFVLGKLLYILSPVNRLVRGYM